MDSKVTAAFKGHVILDRLITKHKCIVIIITFIAITSLYKHVCAQKLPNKQERSVWAPSNIKIDGKLDEWGNKFEAYNHATGVFYAISNDKNNLYLIIRSRDDNTTDKINAGGITVNVRSLHKNSKAGISITYGAIPAKSRFKIVTLKRDTAIDHLVDINKEVTNVDNTIEVKNFDSIPDGRLSIYNQYQLKAATLYNDKHTYSFELCVPLKYIISDFIGSLDINYMVQLNGEDFNSNNMAVSVNGQVQETLSPETKAMINSIIATSSKANSLRELMSPTNFSGIYTLAK